MIGLFNDCFRIPIMDGVSLTTQNYAYWLHKKPAMFVVTPKHRLQKIKRHIRCIVILLFPFLAVNRIGWGFHVLTGLFHERINKLSFELVHAHCLFHPVRLL